VPPHTCLDVALDAGFTSYESGYDNLDVGYTTSYAVTGVPEATLYYYRVRGKNTGGAGPSSNTITRDNPQKLFSDIQRANHTLVRQFEGGIE